MGLQTHRPMRTLGGEHFCLSLPPTVRPSGKAGFLMATDLSLPRLRGLLEAVLKCCDTASNAVLSLLNTSWEQMRVHEWWRQNSGEIRTALGNANEIEKALENAATLCDQNRLSGDANRLRAVRANLVQKLSHIIAFYSPAQQRNPAPDWKEVQSDLWCSLLTRILAVDGDARSCLDSMNDVQFETDQQTGTPSEAPACYVTLLQMAGIVNRSKRTLERFASKPSFPLPVVEGSRGKPSEWRWSDVRPILESEYGRSLPEVFPADRFVR
jgi:hypothetical protein